MLNLDQVDAFIEGRKTYHDAMRRNGWILPDLNYGICSLKFMQGVRAFEIYCPRVNEVKVPPVCLTPPPQMVLIQKIKKGAKIRESLKQDVSKLKELIYHLCKKKRADTAFLVQVLHLVND